MTNEEQVKTLFAEANPIPDADTFDLEEMGGTAYLGTLEIRSSGVTQLDTKNEDREKTRQLRPWFLAATLIILAGVAVILMTQGDEAPTATQPEPTAPTNSTPPVSEEPDSSSAATIAATLDAYLSAYNAGDIDGVMALFSEESVVIAHPTQDYVGEPFATESRGLAEIQDLHMADLNAAANENAYTISNVEIIGNTVTWDHLWVNSQGMEFCKSGNEAVIEDGKFVSWTFPGGGSACP